MKLFQALKMSYLFDQKKKKIETKSTGGYHSVNETKIQ